MTVELDLFELYYFIEGCAKGSHLRQGIWRRCVNQFYGKLTQEERDRLFDWFTRLLWKDICGDKYPNVKEEYKPLNFGLEDFKRTVACFDKNNRYILDVSDGEQQQIVEAYLFEDKYWIDFSRFAPKEYIKEIKKQYEQEES